MNRFFRSMLREYRAVLGDPAVRLIFVAGMVIYTMFYPVPYLREVLREVDIIPVDQDLTPLSRKLTRWVDAAEETRLTEPARDLEEARRRMLNGEARGVLVIPAGFERDILRGEQAVVQVYGDASYFLVYRQIYSGVYRAAATLSAGIEIRRLTASGLPEKEAYKAREPFGVIGRPLYNPFGGYSVYVVPAVLMLIIQQTMLLGIGLLGGTRNELRGEKAAEEVRRSGPLAVLTARTAALVSLYMLYPVFYLAVVYTFYGLPREGNPITVLVFLLPYVISIALFGQMLTAFFTERETALPVLLFTSVPAVFLMRFAWPPEVLPGWIRAVSLLLPSSTGGVGFVRVNQMGASLFEVRREWLILWALCGLYLVLAWLVLFVRKPAAEPQTPEQSA